MRHLKIIVFGFLLLIFIIGCENEEVIEEKTVKIGSTVAFDYAAGFVNGTLFDTSIEEAAVKSGIFNNDRIYQPERIVIGTTPLISGLQEALIGMKEEEIKNVRIEPEKAYGLKIANSTAILPKNSFNNSQNLKINDIVTIINSKGDKAFVFVKELNEENITIDLNHPLAGKVILFAIVVRSIE